MLRKPGGSPGIHIRVCRHFKEKHQDFNGPSGWGSDFDLEIIDGSVRFRGPFSEGLPQINPIFQRGAEFFDSCQISPQDLLALLPDMCGKRFNSLIFGRPRTLPIGIPLMGPGLFLGNGRLGTKRETSPRLGVSLQSIGGWQDLASWILEFPNAHTNCRFDIQP